MHNNYVFTQYEGQGEEDAPQMSEEAILDQLFMSCVSENDTAPVEDIITKVRGVVSAENQVNPVISLYCLKPLELTKT